jgi:CRP-like cAMP-binding protein
MEEVKIEHLELFRDLTAEDLQLVLQKCHKKQAQKGDVLLEYGTEGHCVFIMLSGIAEVQFLNYDDDSYRNICQLRAGQIIGEMSLLDGDNRSARVLLSADSEFLEINREDLFDLMESDFRIGYHIMHNMGRVVSRRLRYTNLAIRHGLFA